MVFTGSMVLCVCFLDGIYYGIDPVWQKHVTRLFYCVLADYAQTLQDYKECILLADFHFCSNESSVLQ